MEWREGGREGGREGSKEGGGRKEGGRDGRRGEGGCFFCMVHVCACRVTVQLQAVFTGVTLLCSPSPSLLHPSPSIDLSIVLPPSFPFHLSLPLFLPPTSVTTRVSNEYEHH